MSDEKEEFEGMDIGIGKVDSMGRIVKDGKVSPSKAPHELPRRTGIGPGMDIGIGKVDSMGRIVKEETV
jgi:hypothetical protein